MRKIKYPRAEALAVAKELCDALRTSCALGSDHKPLLIVAGSLRRRKEEVGDVEILFVPQITEIAEGLFDRRKVSSVGLLLERLLTQKIIAKRRNVNGSEMWGQKNMLAVHLATGIPVDLFSATPENWFNYLVCRTGNAQSNIAVCNAAIGKGWKWNPYGTGFTDAHGNNVPVTSERDAFEKVGLPYLEPWQRNLP